MRRAFNDRGAAAYLTESCNAAAPTANRCSGLQSRRCTSNQRVGLIESGAFGRAFSRRAGAGRSGVGVGADGSAAGAWTCSSRGGAAAGWRGARSRASGRSAGSSFMMLTGGIEAAEGSEHFSGIGARVSVPAGTVVVVVTADVEAGAGVRQLAE